MKLHYDYLIYGGAIVCHFSLGLALFYIYKCVNGGWDFDRTYFEVLCLWGGAGVQLARLGQKIERRFKRLRELHMQRVHRRIERQFVVWARNLERVAEPPPRIPVYQEADFSHLFTVID